eukprot:459567-Prymnesium_polylepis.1
MLPPLQPWLSYSHPAVRGMLPRLQGPRGPPRTAAAERPGTGQSFSRVPRRRQPHFCGLCGSCVALGSRAGARPDSDVRSRPRTPHTPGL